MELDSDIDGRDSDGSDESVGFKRVDSEIFSETQSCGLLKVNNQNYAVEYDSMKVPKFKLKSRKKKRKEPEKKKEQPPHQEPVSICIANSRYTVISKVSEKLNWKMVKEADLWNIYWTDSILGVEFCRYMRRFQKINHFPGMFEICRKDLLARNMNRMFKLFPQDYQIFPKTWHLPADLGDAINFTKTHKNRTYILKPDQGAQGRGISLIRTLKDIKPQEHMICQLYISRPLLIDGFKFDLRVYTLITSIDPLRVYVYNEGLARFATSPYAEPKGHNTTNMYMHLTNYSVNKHSRTYCKDDESGSKRKFSTLNRILSSAGYDIVSLWNNIDDVIVKTIISAWPVLKHNYNASFPTHDIINACFEILGVDIIIDQNLKPWLLEVNHSPSFHMESAVDTEVKYPLIRDTFTMLNIQAKDKRRVINEDKQRINERLLKKIKEMQDRLLNGGQNTENIVQSGVKHQLMRAQIEWEETHMGGFRRVVPVPGDPDRYAAFCDLTSNQASVFTETVTSKRREEAAAKLRTEIADRERFPVTVKLHRVKSEDNFLNPSRKIKRYRHILHISTGFHMEPISESEERERLSLMAQRDFLVRSCDIFRLVCLAFYHNNLLSSADLRMHESCSVDCKFESLHHERKLRLKSITENCDG